MKLTHRVYCVVQKEGDLWRPLGTSLVSRTKAEHMAYGFRLGRKREGMNPRGQFKVVEMVTAEEKAR